jgi:hypothetical protein
MNAGVANTQQRYSGQLMTIGFPNASRSFDVTRNAVRFWGHDRSMETSFYISAEALHRLVPGAAGNQEALLEVFDRNRPRICAAAAKIYGNGRKGGSYDLHSSDF